MKLRRGPMKWTNYHKKTEGLLEKGIKHTYADNQVLFFASNEAFHTQMFIICVCHRGEHINFDLLLVIMVW